MDEDKFNKYLEIITNENCNQKDVDLCIAAFVTNGVNDEQIGFLEKKLAGNKNITSLKLDGIGVTAEGAELLVRLLNVIKNNITSLILQNNKLGEKGVKSVLGFVKESDVLENLSLAWNSDCSSNLKDLSGALTNSSIKSLNLAHCEISNRNFELFTGILKEQMLRTLDLSDNYLSTKSFVCLLESFENNKNLEVLRLKSNNISGSELNGKLKSFLESNKTLIELDLANNKLGCKGAKEIAKSLKTNNTLKKLNLTNNNVGDEGFKKILESLPDNANIEELSVANNNITDEGAIALANAIKRGVNISHINLKNNIITDAGAKHLVDAIKPNKFAESNRRATELNLNDNKISDKTLIEEIEGIFAEIKLPHVNAHKIHLPLPPLPFPTRARRKSSPAAISSAYTYQEEGGKGKEKEEMLPSYLLFGTSLNKKDPNSKDGFNEYKF